MENNRERRHKFCDLLESASDEQMYKYINIYSCLKMEDLLMLI